jgi:hypothetical protein
MTEHHANTDTLKLNYVAVFLTMSVPRAFGTNSVLGQQYSDFRVEDSYTPLDRSGPPVTALQFTNHTAYVGKKTSS